MENNSTLVLGAFPSGKKGEIDYISDRRAIERLEENTDFDPEDADLIREFRGQNGYLAYQCQGKIYVVANNSYWVYKMDENGRQTFEE